MQEKRAKSALLEKKNWINQNVILLGMAKLDGFVFFLF